VQLQEANLLFIDAPIGAGFSYTDRSTLYSTNIDEMSADLLTFVKIFMSKKSSFSGAIYLTVHQNAQNLDSIP
jgi:serine carboxypeptidase 1